MDERGLREVLDDALDDLPRYMAVTQPAKGWLPGEGECPTMIACVSVDDAREMIRRADRKTDSAGFSFTDVAFEEGLIDE